MVSERQLAQMHPNNTPAVMTCSFENSPHSVKSIVQIKPVAVIATAASATSPSPVALSMKIYMTSSATKNMQHEAASMPSGPLVSIAKKLSPNAFEL